MEIDIYVQTFTDTLRRRNRALSTVNRKLRQREEALIAQRDETVEALLETPNAAEEAFGELWGNALFDCGPQDYDYMVEVIKKAFAFIESHNGDGTQLVASIINKQV